MNQIIPEYINYGFENLFPQTIAGLAIKSPTNQKSLDLKTMMVQGEGIDLTNIDSDLCKILNNLSSDGASINTLLQKISRDYVIFGGFALKVTWNGNGYIRYIDHIPFEDVRVGTPINTGKKLEIPYYVVNNNWGKKLNLSQETLNVYAKFNPNDFEREFIPESKLGLLEPTDDQTRKQLFYYYDYKPKVHDFMLFYPVPDYISAFDAIDTEIKIVESYSNLPNDAKLFQAIYENTIQSIITAHGVWESLLNNKGLTNENMLLEYNIFQQVSINSYQKRILNELNKLIQYIGFNHELKIIPHK